jgi:hypothetical protein
MLNLNQFLVLGCPSYVDNFFLIIVFQACSPLSLSRAQSPARFTLRASYTGAVAKLIV